MFRPTVSDSVYSSVSSSGKFSPHQKSFASSPSSPTSVESGENSDGGEAADALIVGSFERWINKSSHNLPGLLGKTEMSSVVTAGQPRQTSTRDTATTKSHETRNEASLRFERAAASSTARLRKRPVCGWAYLFLQFRDLMSCYSVCRKWKAEFDNKKLLRDYLVRAAAGPSRNRLMIWSTLAGVHMVKKNCRAEALAKAADSNSFSQSIEAEIWRDVRRTFPRRPLFNQPGGAGQTLLAHVLKQCAILNTDIGYCQGMNYVAAVLVSEALEFDESLDDLSGRQVVKTYSYLDSKVEENILWLMHALIHTPRFRMRGLWRKGVPALKLRLFQFDCLVQSILPVLHAHFNKLNLKPEQYCSQWFVTLFASTHRLPLLRRIWDLFLLEGWSFLFKVAMASLAVRQSQLLKMDLEGASKFFREQKLKGGFSVPLDELLECTKDLYIPDQQLTMLEQKFKYEEAMYLLTQKTSTLPKKSVHKFRQMEQVALADAAVLRQKVEVAIEALAKAQRLVEGTQISVSRFESRLGLLKEHSMALTAILDTTRHSERSELQAQIDGIQSQQEALMAEYRVSLMAHEGHKVMHDEALQRKTRFGQQLVIVLEDWEARRVAAVIQLFDEVVGI